MNSNCSLLIFLINSQRDVLSLAACVWTRLDCHAMGMGTGREGGQLPAPRRNTGLAFISRAGSIVFLCRRGLCGALTGRESQVRRTVRTLNPWDWEVDELVPGRGTVLPR